MTMDRQPVLKGERLVLRPLAATDWAGLFGVAADPLLWELHPMHTRWQEPVFRAMFDEALGAGGALVVTERATGAVIGSSQYRGFDPAAGGVVEIGWSFLARSHWGGAFNRELKHLMLAHAFGSVARVEFRVGEANLRSRRALEKIGARLSERVDVVAGPDGPIRHVIYEITREGFASSPLSP